MKNSQKYFHRNNRQGQSGFSLFETLVAIFILMLAIAGAMSLTQKSLSASYYARDQVIASFLAQDAIEYIRNIRDKAYNITQGQHTPELWGTYFGTYWPGSGASSSFKIDTTADPTTNPVNAFSGDGSTCQTTNLIFHSSTGIYNHDDTDGSPPSRFYRCVTMTSNAAGNEVLLDVVVGWKTGSFPSQSIEVKDILMDWGEVE